MMNLDDYLKTIPDKEYIGCKIKVNDKFDIEDVRLDPKYSYLHMPFGKLQKSLLLRILSRPNPLFTELCKTVRRHIAGGANGILISVYLPSRLCSPGGDRRLLAEWRHAVVALFEEQESCF